MPYSREWYLRNKASVLERHAKNKAAIRAEVRAIKAAKGCERCGESHPGCLDFHHEDDKLLEVSTCVSNGWSLARILTEIDKCSVVCSNCHRKHHDDLRHSDVIQ